MLIIKITTEDDEREVPIAGDGDWGIENEAGYLIINRVDGVRIFYPITAVKCWEVGPIK